MDDKQSYYELDPNYKGPSAGDEEVEEEEALKRMNSKLGQMLDMLMKYVMFMSTGGKIGPGAGE